jgi:hypothetical protein
MTRAADQNVEIVNYRLTAKLPLPRPEPQKIPFQGESPEAALKQFRRAYFDDWIDCPVYARDKLSNGNRLAGPAIIEQVDSTIVIYPGQKAHVDCFGKRNSAEMTGAVDPLCWSSSTQIHVGCGKMGHLHSGYSTVLRESEDGSAGLLDADLRTVAVSKKLPFHFASFSAVREHLPRYFSLEDLEEDDVLLFNHPFEGNVTHTSDTITLMPVFLDGLIVGYSGTLAHKPDLGGVRGLTAARDLWEEGLVIPPVKYHTRGAVSRDGTGVGANSIPSGNARFARPGCSLQSRRAPSQRAVHPLRRVYGSLGVPRTDEPRVEPSSRCAEGDA